MIVIIIATGWASRDVIYLDLIRWATTIKVLFLVLGIRSVIVICQ